MKIPISIIPFLLAIPIGSMLAQISEPVDVPPEPRLTQRDIDRARAYSKPVAGRTEPSVVVPSGTVETVYENVSLMSDTHILSVYRLSTRGKTYLIVSSSRGVAITSELP